MKLLNRMGVATINRIIKHMDISALDFYESFKEKYDIIEQGYYMNFLIGQGFNEQEAMYIIGFERWKSFHLIF